MELVQDDKEDGRALTCDDDIHCHGIIQAVPAERLSASAGSLLSENQPPRYTNVT